jgi:hypothetical protein
MGITPLPCYYKPLRHPLVFGRFPSLLVIRPTFRRRFLGGTGRASPVARPVLVMVGAADRIAPGSWVVISMDCSPSAVALVSLSWRMKRLSAPIGLASVFEHDTASR